MRRGLGQQVSRWDGYALWGIVWHRRGFCSFFNERGVANGWKRDPAELRETFGISNTDCRLRWSDLPRWPKLCLIQGTLWTSVCPPPVPDFSSLPVAHRTSSAGHWKDLRKLHTSYLILCANQLNLDWALLTWHVTGFRRIQLLFHSISHGFFFGPSIITTPIHASLGTPIHK